MAKHTYSVGTRDFSTLAAARKDAREYANELGRSVTITHLIQKTDSYTRTRGRVLGFSASDIKYGPDIEVQPSKKTNPRRKKKRNLWPFDAFKQTTVYRAKSGRKRTTAGKAYKGHLIYKQGDAFVVPSIDSDSMFDTRGDAQRFITNWNKQRPNPKQRVIVPAQIKITNGRVRVFVSPSAMRRISQ